jgi:flagellar secretion chaperone FliS
VYLEATIMTLSSQRDTYLESRALTAPSYRLHLMLIEGAIRFGRQAAEALGRDDQLAAVAPLMRVVDIAGELLAGVRGQQTELNRQIAGVYWYLFRVVSIAKINADAAKLAEALELLEFERQTWRMLCEKLGGETMEVRTLAALGQSAASASSAFSLEA